MKAPGPPGAGLDRGDVGGRLGRVLADELLLLSRPAVPVRAIGVAVAVQGATATHLVGGCHPDAEIGQRAVRGGQGADPFQDESGAGLDCVPGSRGASGPVPLAPSSRSSLRARCEQLGADVLDRPRQPVPARVDVVEADHRTGRPPLLQVVGQRRLARP